MKAGKIEVTEHEVNKQVKILTHKNNKFLKIDDVNLGEETVDAMRSELLI